MGGPARSRAFFLCPFRACRSAASFLRSDARHPAARGDPRRRRHRLRSRRRDGGARAHPPRRPGDAARGGPDARPLPGVQGAPLAVRVRAPGGRARRAALLRRGEAVRLLLDHERRLGARRRTVHGRRRHRRLLVVPVPHRRRPDQPLRADDVPLLRLRLRAAGPGRAGVELAHHVRGRRAPTTTRPRRSSASPGAARASAARRTACSTTRRRPRRTSCSFSGRATSWGSRASPTGGRSSRGR